MNSHRYYRVGHVAYQHNVIECPLMGSAFFNYLTLGIAIIINLYRTTKHYHIL